MDTDEFWQIIDAARAQTGEEWWLVPGLVTDALAQLPLAEIADFAQVQEDLAWAAHREDVRTACRLINAGFGSTDVFVYFRQWLLVQGRTAFEAALADPDTLLDVPGVAEMDPIATDGFASCEAFLSVANDAWNRATGAPEPTIELDRFGFLVGDGDEVDGLEEELDRRGFDRWPEDKAADEPIEFTDRAAVFAALPRLSARFYDRAWRD